MLRFKCAIEKVPIRFSYHPWMNENMSISKTKPYTKTLKAMMRRKAEILSKAQVFSEIDMKEAAQPIWLSAAGYEERIASMLDVLGRELEGAMHRISAASCYEKAGDPSRAANLYRAALLGPLREDTRREVENMLSGCLVALKRLSVENISSAEISGTRENL